MRKFILYGMNGAINSVLSYGLFLYLIGIMDYRVAIFISYPTGMLISYVLNGAIVFGSRGHLPLFIAVNLLLLLANVGVTWFLVEAFRQPKAVAQILAIGVVFVMGFLMNKHVVFAKGARQSSAHRA